MFGLVERAKYSSCRHGSQMQDHTSASATVSSQTRATSEMKGKKKLFLVISNISFLSD